MKSDGGGGGRASPPGEPAAGTALVGVRLMEPLLQGVGFWL